MQTKYHNTICTDVYMNEWNEWKSNNEKTLRIWYTENSLYTIYTFRYTFDTFVHTTKIRSE